MVKRMTFTVLIMTAPSEILNSSDNVLGRLSTSLSKGMCPMAFAHSWEGGTSLR